MSQVAPVKRRQSYAEIVAEDTKSKPAPKEMVMEEVASEPVDQEKMEIANFQSLRKGINHLGSVEHKLAEMLDFALDAEEIKTVDNIQRLLRQLAVRMLTREHITFTNIFGDE